MIIERITKIKDYRIFKDFSWPDDLHNFSRFNLIYGWNGSGKTTLSNLFTHLQKNEDISQGDIRLQVDGSIINGNSISSSAIPQVRVFNRDTMDRSLFEVPNHQLPPVYYLGEDSAEKQKRVEELKTEHESQEGGRRKLQSDLSFADRSLNEFCANKAAEIKNLLTSSGGGPYNNYNRGDFRNSSENFIKYVKNPYCLLDEEYSRCISTKDSVVMPDVSFHKTSLPDYVALLNEVSQILKRSVVSKVLTELVENPDVATWVQRGLPLHIEKNITDTCHFCKQPLPEERINQIESHFSDELTNFQEEIDASILRIEQCKKVVDSITFPEINLLYPHIREDYEKTVSTWNSTKLSVIVFLDALLKSLAEKREKPFKVLEISEFVTISDFNAEDKGFLLKTFELIVDATQNISAVFGLVSFNKIFTIIDLHNSYSKNYIDEVSKDKRLLAGHSVSMQLGNYIKKINKIAELKAKLKNAETQLAELNDEKNRLEQDVHEHARAVEELNSEMSAYLGRDELKFEVKDNGYIISRNGHPAMNLSEGERTAIAFIYFLKTLEDTSFDMSNGVVVIDDPISSLDANSMYSAFGFMRARTKDINQLFVLTHNFTFFRHVRKWFFEEPKLPVIQGRQGSNDYRTPSRFYMLDTQINDGERNSLIKDLDPLLKDYESEYHYIFRKIHDLVNNAENQELEHYYGLPNVARRLLESFLTFKLPNYSAGSVGKKLDEIPFDEAKKIRILRFLHVHSHYDQVGAPEHDLSLLSEAPAVLKDVMDLIKEIDPEHYAGMESFFAIPDITDEVSEAGSEARGTV